VWQPALDSNGLLAHFLKFEWRQAGSSHSLQRAPATVAASSNVKKGRQLQFFSAAGFCTRLDGQHNPLRAEKPSEDLTRCLFLMNMKGLKVCGTSIRNGKEFQKQICKIL
jgi:hypothetical protein